MNRKRLPSLEAFRSNNCLFRRMIFTIISGGAASKLAEGPVKGGDAFEAGRKSNLRNVHIGIGQEKLGTLHSLKSKVLGEVVTGSRFKQSGKIVRTEAELFGNMIQRNDLFTILTDKGTGMRHLAQGLMGAFSRVLGP